MPDPSPSTLTVLNSNFFQLGRRSGGRPTADSLPQAVYLTTVKHTASVGIEPTTFRSWVRRATSCATETILSIILSFSHQRLFTAQNTIPVIIWNLNLYSVKNAKFLGKMRYEKNPSPSLPPEWCRSWPPWMLKAVGRYRRELKITLVQSQKQAKTHL